MLVATTEMTTITHLECSLCGKKREAGRPHNLCECGGPLLVRYDLEKVRQSWNREWIASGPSTMWRYAPVLPVSKPGSIVSLGEGMTPLIRTERLGQLTQRRNSRSGRKAINCEKTVRPWFMNHCPPA
jgi:threonine synthase